MSYVLTWSDGVGRVGTNTYLYDVTVKPTLDFAYDALYYETSTSLYIKVLNDNQKDLTDEEKELCLAYCKAFEESDEYICVAIDPDLKLYEGYMPRGEAKDKGLEVVAGAVPPDHPMSKWDGNQWRKIVAAIDEDGKLYLLPAQDNLKYNFVFTEKEWDAFPHPTYDDELYDFQSNEWKDARSLSGSKTLAEQRVRALYLQDFRNYQLVHFEIDPIIDMIQLKELLHQDDTPFVDAMAAEMGSDKTTILSRIQAHYAEDFLTDLGTLHGKMYKAIDGVRAAETLEALDLVMLPLFANTKYPWRRPAKVVPYASEN